MDKEKYYILIKGKCHHGDIKILDIYVLKTKTPKFIEETLLNLKSFIDPHTWIVDDLPCSCQKTSRSDKNQTGECWS